MHAITKLAPLVLRFRPSRALLGLAVLGGMVAPQGCENVAVDTTGGGTPPAGVVRGTVFYDGPPPCSQNGHIVGNAVILIFDARNPPPPNGLGVTAANFGVISGDSLFADWPVTEGATKICPSANAPTFYATAPYVISPLAPGQYVMQAFFDYTNDFFATFKFRQLPEATDIGGGYIDVNAAQQLYPETALTMTLPDGGSFTPVAQTQSNPNYQPDFLPVNSGTAGPVPPPSLRGIPSFTMPDTGYLADDIPVTIAEKLLLARPYFYPAGVAPSSVAPVAQPLSTIVASQYPSSERPPTAVDTLQNPSGNVDFIPVLSFPQDATLYAAPTVNALEKEALGGPAAPLKVLSEYQSAFPQLKLNVGVAAAEQQVAADTTYAANVFHMQLSANPTAGAAPGGNGGIFVWWNACDGLPGCNSSTDDWIPEGPGLVYRMWPLVVLSKLDDLTVSAQPDPNDPESINAQGADLTKPIVIIQGITLLGDAFVTTTIEGQALAGSALPLPYPDPTNLATDHVSVLLRPSVLCLDPRAPDYGGVNVTAGKVDPASGNLLGPFPPSDVDDGSQATPPAKGVIVASANLSANQLSKLVNHKAAGTVNGLMGGCLPTGRYAINVVYPTGQAWTTPNETGSCAAAEGSTLFSGSGTPSSSPGAGQFLDPLVTGCSQVFLSGATSGPLGARPVLYSQGTRAVVEITPTANLGNCATYAPNGQAPKDESGNLTPNGAPFACTGLCADPTKDPTSLSPSGIPCYAPLASQ
jgi:hypothetical protein